VGELASHGMTERVQEDAKLGLACPEFILELLSCDSLAFHCLSFYFFQLMMVNLRSTQSEQKRTPSTNAAQK